MHNSIDNRRRRLASAVVKTAVAATGLTFAAAWVVVAAVMGVCTTWTARWAVRAPSPTRVAGREPLTR